MRKPGLIILAASLLLTGAWAAAQSNPLYSTHGGHYRLVRGTGPCLEDLRMRLQGETSHLIVNGSDFGEAALDEAQALNGDVEASQSLLTADRWVFNGWQTDINNHFSWNSDYSRLLWTQQSVRALWQVVPVQGPTPTATRLFVCKYRLVRPVPHRVNK